jgi:REP element-mobilizing transposase RayT
MRVRPGIGYLRTQRRAQVVLEAIEAVNRRGDFQVVDYVILGNHLHLIVEADDETALARGMQALNIRVAIQLNSLQNRRGPVYVDRYHAHVLKSRREVSHALRYLQRNYRSHTHESLPPDWRDPLARQAARPRTWLLRAADPAG